MDCVAATAARPTVLRSTVWGSRLCRPTHVSCNLGVQMRRMAVVSENLDKEECGSWSGNLARSTVALLAVGSILLTPTEVLAAKSGGRVGGSTFRSSPSPQQQTRNYTSSRTNVYVTPPPIAPPIYGGYGWGGTPFFGGWSPFYSYGPTVAIGGGGGFISFLFFVAIAGLLVNVARSIFNSRDED